MPKTLPPKNRSARFLNGQCRSGRPPACSARSGCC